MCDTKNVNEVLEVVGKVLIRCFAMVLLVLLFWWAVLVLAGDLTYSVHSKFIPISRAQFNMIHYAGIALMKTVAFVVFLAPYIAIRLVIRKRAS